MLPVIVQLGALAAVNGAVMSLLTALNADVCCSFGHSSVVECMTGAWSIGCARFRSANAPQVGTSVVEQQIVLRHACWLFHLSITCRLHCFDSLMLIMLLLLSVAVQCHDGLAVVFAAHSVRQRC